MGCSAAVCFLSALRHCAAVLGAGGSVHHIHSCRGSEPAVGGASSAHAGARRVRSQPCSPTLRTPPQSRFSVRLDSWQWFAVARIRPAWSSRHSEIHGQQADKRSEETSEDARASSVTLGLSMDIAALRPILAGLIGAVIAAWFLRKISTDSPQFCVQRRLTEYLRDPTAELRDVASQFNALPVYSDLGGTLFITTSLQVLSIRSDDSIVVEEHARRGNHARLRLSVSDFMPTQVQANDGISFRSLCIVAVIATAVAAVCGLLSYPRRG